MTDHKNSLSEGDVFGPFQRIRRLSASIFSLGLLNGGQFVPPGSSFYGFGVVLFEYEKKRG